MYVPSHFRLDEPEQLLAAMRDIAAATFVGLGPNGLIATHAPVEVSSEPAPHGRLRCHFARANPHVKALAEGQEMLAIFQGPGGYVSPSWYPTKQTNGGKVVPTWNYLAIHAYGAVRLFEGRDALLPHLVALTARHEGERQEPWAVADAPDDFIEAMCRGIIGVEMTLTRIDGKKKMSQNRPQADRAGVVAALLNEGRPDLATLTQEA